MKTQTVRIFLAIIAICLAVCIMFFIVPTVQGNENEEVTIVVATENIDEGRLITEKNITTKMIAKKYLPQGAITEKEKLIGQYAATNIFAGDYFIANKVSKTSSNPSEWTSELDAQHVAISFTIRNFAAGLSAKIQADDIISIIALADGADRPNIPAELTYVRVLAVTANTAEEYIGSKENQEENLLPVTITIMATPEQAIKIAELDINGNIYVALVSRDDPERAKTLLAEQDAVLKELLQEPQP